MQSLAGINVSTTVRMTVVKLRSGGLWVHAPVAPSRHATVSESARGFVLRAVMFCLLDLSASSRVGCVGARARSACQQKNLAESSFVFA